MTALQTERLDRILKQSARGIHTVSYRLLKHEQEGRYLAMFREIFDAARELEAALQPARVSLQSDVGTNA